MLLLLFLAMPCSMRNFPTQGLNPCPLHWKHGVLTTEPPGKSGRGVMKDLLGRGSKLGEKINSNYLCELKEYGSQAMKRNPSVARGKLISWQLFSQSIK